VIRPIDNAEALEATQLQATRDQLQPATAAGKTFANVLAREKTTTGGTTADAAAQAAKAPKHKKEAIDAPDGEVWRPVRGNDNYAKIIDGPRAGQYINLSRGARRGETFHVEVRDGVRVHVYGEGENEKVIPALKDSGRVPDGKHDAHAAQRVKGEQWAPVDGVSNYADILSGPRNGYYVNTSGGVRDGMAFQIVTKNGHTYHVYGKGKHRQMIEVHGPAKKADDTKASDTKGSDTKTDDTKSSTESTGGTTAADTE
jgi:hypothetical protein